MTNSLGTFVRDQLALLGWTRDDLAEATGIDEWTLEAILDAPVLPEWPEPAAMIALARAVNVPVREIVLQSAQGCGLNVLGALNPTETLQLASSAELMGEVRRRLTLGVGAAQLSASGSVGDLDAQSA